MNRLHSAFGLLAFVGIAWGISENRKAVSPRLLLAGVLSQVVIAAVLLKVPFVTSGFAILSKAIDALQTATEAGTQLVFGYLGGGPAPFEVSSPGATYILAFRALPLILVVSALTEVLTYWRILPAIVRLFSAMLQKTFGIRGAVGLSTAANVFVGMVEGPLFVRAYLNRMTRSELFVLMTAGMASIAGTVLVVYASVISPVVPHAAAHLMIASIMSAPAAVTIAMAMIPETVVFTDTGAVESEPMSAAQSTMDAITLGTKTGLDVLLLVVASLIVLVSLVFLVNGALGFLPELGGVPISLQRTLGWAMTPVTWLMGIPWHESGTAGALMGTKTILNEFLAYLQMSHLPAGALSPRSQTIMTYALCGFANFGSLGILLGGLCAAAPERRAEIVSMGGKSIIAGTIATCCTGAVVGIYFN
ncbi:MAG: nucleoside transporter C-terminal domain-containing protein [Deltaproteobacteria bacterium]|nr:nucleoside transporter C-terminal domain-containing protein [Deltaproteobacteria bacterium]